MASAKDRKLRVAIIHYWLINMRGGEKVVEALSQIFPDADIFTHVFVPENISESIKKHVIKTSFIQKLPKADKYYKNYLPLMPLALEQLDLRKYDLIISSESGPAKGIITSPDSLHICYCHTPMRYLWDMYHDYRNSTGLAKRLIMPLVFHYLRIWDQFSANRVDHFIANSSFVAKRIKKYYKREAEIIHPPVDTGSFSHAEVVEDFYLMVGQLVTYKRFDIAIEAFNKNGKKLIIIGEGILSDSLRKMAKTNITIMGHQPFEVIRKHYSLCKALIFPGIEDFGIVPVEAMASGRPVIGYGNGGILDIVTDDLTGVLFNHQTVESLNRAIERFEESIDKYSSKSITSHASKFDRENFIHKITKFIDEKLNYG